MPLLHLEDLPVLSEICMYLPKVEVQDITNFSGTCKTLRNFITMDASFKEFWYQMLLRAGHQKYKGVDFTILTSCYQKQITPASFYFIRGMNDIRKVMGECQNRCHLRYKIDQSMDHLNERNLYREWQCVMWRRIRSRYWCVRDEKKWNQMQGDLSRLSERKERFANLDRLYTEMTKQETKRLSKLSKKKENK